MIIENLWCSNCKSMQPCLSLPYYALPICPKCDGEDFNYLLGYKDDIELPKIIRPSKGESR